MADTATWDDRHSEALRNGDYPREPQPFLLEHAGDLPTTGRALEIAAGLGRNTAWIAQLGLKVTAVDASSVAVAHLAARARSDSLPIEARVLDLPNEPLPSGSFDLIVNTLFLVRDLAPEIERRLTPGGVLVFVTLLENGSGPPVGQPEFRLRRGELAELFPSLERLELREDPSDATRPLASLLARRPEVTPA